MANSYSVLFPNDSLKKKFYKALDNITQKSVRNEVMDKVIALKTNPRHSASTNFRSIKGGVSVSKYTAQYRLRIGDYRVLFDIDDNEKVVWVLALRKRDETTYK